MNDLEKLTNIIRGELPRLMIPTDGCVVYTNIKPDTSIVIGKNGYSISSDKVIIDDCAPSDSKNKYQKITKVIGHEPMLNDVFDFVNVFFNNRTLESKSEKIYNEGQKKIIYDFLIDSWQMEFPYLKDQRQYVINGILDSINIPELVQFQIESVYTDGSKSWDYFKSEVNEETILKQSIEIVKAEYQKKLDRRNWDFFANIDMPRPTIHINQYPKKKGGLKFKTKWR